MTSFSDFIELTVTFNVFFEMSCGVRKLPIGCLSPDITNALLVAVIIAKRNVKTFASKKDSEERGVWNLTLRDSVIDTINATLWGSSEFANSTYRMFNTGDVVEILNPRVLFKQPDSSDAMFCPVVSSPFQLHLLENVSEILLYSNDDMGTVRNLIQIPTKSPGDFLRLSDVISYGQAMRGEYVNLLVAVRNVDEVKYITSKKDAKNLICRQIVVMDQSYLEFHMTLWSEDTIQRSDRWRSKQTVIFFADVKLKWDSYRRRATAIITSRTIVTENPKTTEALALGNFAKSAPTHPTAILDHFASNVVDASKIHLVMTTAQVLDRAYNRKCLEDKFTALLFVNVTYLNLDGFEMVTAYTCSLCSQALGDTETCLNSECLTLSRKEVGGRKLSYNLTLNLTDHRGTLHNCRLVSPAADDILGCSVNAYAKMSNEEKTALKWKLLLTHCEARILVLCTSPERPRPLISLLRCRPTEIKDMASKLPIY